MSRRAAPAPTGAPDEDVHALLADAPLLEPIEVVALLNECGLENKPDAWMQLDDLIERYSLARAFEVSTPKLSNYQAYFTDVTNALDRLVRVLSPAPSGNAIAVDGWARLETHALERMGLTPTENRQLLARAIESLRASAAELRSELRLEHDSLAPEWTAFDSLTIEATQFCARFSPAGGRSRGVATLMWALYERLHPRAKGTFKGRYFHEKFGDPESLNKAITRIRRRAVIASSGGH